MKLFKSALLLLCLIITTNISAHEVSFFKDVPVNFNIGTGMVNGTYSNPIQEAYAGSSAVGTGFSVTPSFAFNVEIFSTVQKSWNVKAQISLDSADNKMRYSYLGGGANYYFGAGNIMSSMDERWNHYAGYDIGLSRIIIESFGPSLNAVSTAIDVGGHIGTNYRLNKEWKINAEVGYSHAFGFSTVSSNGSNIKSFVGISHTLL